MTNLLSAELQKTSRASSKSAFNSSFGCGSLGTMLPQDVGVLFGASNFRKASDPNGTLLQLCCEDLASSLTCGLTTRAQVNHSVTARGKVANINLL